MNTKLTPDELAALKAHIEKKKINVFANAEKKIGEILDFCGPVKNYPTKLEYLLISTDEGKPAIKGGIWSQEEEDILQEQGYFKCELPEELQVVATIEDFTSLQGAKFQAWLHEYGCELRLYTDEEGNQAGHIYSIQKLEDRRKSQTTDTLEI